ncbi:hypothetical protein [Botrimarina sp.]|uniref:hypothetical protein n=1 Tax=Botrimarina sp. TaxID=2795802 RepID=UPI0032EECB57
MTTKAPSQKPSAPRGRWALRVLVLLAAGGVLYYGLEATDRAVVGNLEEAAADPMGSPVIELPPQLAAESSTAGGAAVADGPGNRLLASALVAIGRHRSIAGNWRQVGVIQRRSTELTGVYQQTGSDEDRRFRLELTGSLAGQPTRLIRVSDSRFLWTDLTWGPTADSLQRAVTRVDLRRVRRALDGAIDAEAYPRFGGVPMLLAGLNDAFRFGDPRRMRLADEYVVAMIGYWRNDSPAGAPADRAPHHVAVALEEQGLMPRLVEYRAAGDPLSADGLSDTERLRSSQRPLLRLELGGLQTGVRVNPSAFAYEPPEQDWIDETDRELQLAEARRQRTAVAGAGGGSVK